MRWSSRGLQGGHSCTPHRRKWSPPRGADGFRTQLKAVFVKKESIHRKIKFWKNFHTISTHSDLLTINFDQMIIIHTSNHLPKLIPVHRTLTRATHRSEAGVAAASPPTSVGGQLGVKKSRSSSLGVDMRTRVQHRVVHYSSSHRCGTEAPHLLENVKKILNLVIKINYKCKVLWKL